ncbi:interleukin 17-like protein [Lytechinus variegatus]|uniref:interleukin 17-like protein n=1 Tax=Lytechinus variegatus TaxID=7654 RepID=UPI001BB22AD2|nr:interleukin 17-like protein [Lytechinus variegatus]
MEESASGFGFTVTSNGEEDAAMRSKRNIQDAVDGMHTCRYPTEAELTTQLQTQDVQMSQSDSDNDISHRYQNTCDSSLFDLTQEKREQRALCPYKMVTDIDNQRFPREISYARCACTQCVNSSNTGFLPRGRAKCLPVTRQTEVLIRGDCDEGVYSFKKVLIQVPVACVCTRTRVTALG